MDYLYVISVSFSATFTLNTLAKRLSLSIFSYSLILYHLLFNYYGRLLAVCAASTSKFPYTIFMLLNTRTTTYTRLLFFSMFLILSSSFSQICCVFLYIFFLVAFHLSIAESIVVFSVERKI